jgi:hypothetical protein
MRTINLLAGSLLMTLVVISIIVLTSYVMHIVFCTDCTLQSITFCMAMGCMWQYFYNEFKKEK